MFWHQGQWDKIMRPPVAVRTDSQPIIAWYKSKIPQHNSWHTLVVSIFFSTILI